MNPDFWLLSWGRDPFSMTSHLGGAVLSLVATYHVVRRARRHDMDGLGVGVYGLVMTLAFSASALFHFVDAGSPRYELYNKVDHLAIFFMIAATGTAIYGSIQSRRASRLTGILWLCALVGIVLKFVLWPLPNWINATMYLVLGWFGSLGVLAIAQVQGWRSVRLFLWGALAFSVGAMVFALQGRSLWTGPLQPHGVFHLLVLAGAAFHFAFIYRRCSTRAFAHVALPAFRVPVLQKGRAWLTRQ